jgi:hypothetical protein
VEDGHERESRVLLEHFFEIAHAEEHSDHHGETERAVDGDARHDGTRDNDLCVVDLLGQLSEVC